MRLTPGERRALWSMILVAAVFLPPVTNCAAGVRVRVIGVPFLVFWSACAIVLTAVVTSAALRIKDRVDGRDDR